MQTRTIDLTRGSIMKALLLFAVPLFISNLFQQLYNTADTMIVGNVLGDQSLAAIGSTSAVFELIIGFANGVGSGFGIVIACLWGANDREKLKKAVASSLILSPPRATRACITRPQTSGKSFSKVCLLPPGSQEPGGFFADFYTDFTRIIRKKQQGTFALPAGLCYNEKH